VSLLLVCLVAGPAPLAFADPPDPTWIGGYWDDDDFDNVVDFIAQANAVVGLPPSAGPSETVIIILESPEPRTPPAPVHATASPRAPPLSSSSS